MFSSNTSTDACVEPCPRDEQHLPIWALCVSVDGDDQVALRHVLSQRGYQLAGAATCSEAAQCLESARYTVVICNSDLPDGTWRDLLGVIHTSSSKPALIVTSHAVDERFWAEVLNLGGFDVLTRPFRMQELRYVIENASLRMSTSRCTALDSVQIPLAAEEII